MSEEEREARERAKELSRHWCIQHVNKNTSNKYYVSDMYHSGMTVVSYRNGEEVEYYE